MALTQKDEDEECQHGRIRHRDGDRTGGKSIGESNVGSGK